MLSVIYENPTRKKIMFLLKKRGALSIDDISKELNITSMGIRQHLLSLEKRDLIDYVAKRQGIGRPAFLYKLTDKADDLFPKEYREFVVTALKDIEKNEGRDKIDEIFKWRKNRLLKYMKDNLLAKKTFRDKVYGFKDILESKGYLVEFNVTNNHYTLKQFNCPIYKLAAEFKEACRYELQMYKDLLGRVVSREQCISDGDLSCTYIIPKNGPK
jgi:predicted ArsR family transcriptional regulator